MIRFRVSIMPIVGIEFRHKFESIVIRVLDDRKVITDLNKLGLQGPAQDFFDKAIAKPQGIVILTGPTGSGKSTTLVAALHQVIDPTVNVLTVEDPVEYIIKGARQLKIGPKMNFDQAIRGILRHDPDIVLVGEMRDKSHRGDRHQAGEHGSPDVLHAAHERCAERGLPSLQDGDRTVPDRLCDQHHRRPAPDPDALSRPASGRCRRSEIDRETYLKFGFTEEDLDSSHDLRGGRVRQVQRRVQGTCGHPRGALLHQGDPEPDHRVRGRKSTRNQSGAGDEGRDVDAPPRRDRADEEGKTTLEEIASATTDD